VAFWVAFFFFAFLADFASWAALLRRVLAGEGAVAGVVIQATEFSLIPK
jgi:hypothetical protein